METTFTSTMPPLLGRSDELRRLAACRERPLVTLVGPPGVGKTRLAREAADSDTIWVAVEEGLAAEATGERVALAAGLKADVGTDPARLAAALAGSAQMVVLDDAHRQPALGPFWAEVLARAPTLRVLATGQRALGVPGETVLALAGLPANAARDLYLERATRIAGPVPDDDALTELVGRLDGLPLAIELAAARATTRTPSELLEELADRFAALEPGPHPGPLWATLHRAWASLAPAAQRALATVAELDTPLPLPGVRAVIDLAQLDELVARSLLARDVLPSGRARFRVLESVRDFVVAQGTTADPWPAYVAWVCTEAERLRAAVEVEPVAALRELADLRPHLLRAWGRGLEPHATTIALGLDALMIRTGPAREHERILERQLAAVEPQSGEALALLGALSRVHQIAHRYRRSRALLERAIDLADALGRSVEGVKLRYFLTRSLLQAYDDPPAARRAAEATLKAARAEALPTFEAGAWTSLGTLALDEGDPARAVELHLRADRTLPDDDRSRIRPVIACHLARARLALGEPLEAAAHVQLAQSLVEGWGDDVLAGRLLPLVARVATAQGHTEEAQQALDRAARIADREDDLALAVETLVERARIAARSRSPDAAHRLAEATARGSAILTPRLQREIEAVRAKLAPRLRVATDGSGFRAAEVVDLRRRSAPRRILTALAEASRPLDVHELTAIGWPGQSIHPESAQKRVWTAIWTLRRLGLGERLVQRDDGYTLDGPIARVAFEDL